MTSLATFDPLIAQRSLLKHPFYQRWSRGELSLEDLRVYAKEYFHLVRAVPSIVSRVRDRALKQKPSMVPMIEQNLREETEHVDLWKRFAASVGVSEAELETHEACATVQDAVASLEEVAGRTFEEGVAGLYALERELAAIAETKKDGLSKFYGLRSEDAHVYFDEHLNEAKHLHVWMEVAVPQQEGEQAVRDSLDAQNAVLDGVCVLRGIHC